MSILRALEGRAHTVSKAVGRRRSISLFYYYKVISYSTIRFFFGRLFPNSDERSCICGDDWTSGIAWRVVMIFFRLWPRIPSGSSFNILLNDEKIVWSLPVVLSRGSSINILIDEIKAVIAVAK